MKLKSVVSGFLLCKIVNCHLFKFVLFPFKRKILPRSPRKKVVLVSSILLIDERSNLFTFSSKDYVLWFKTMSYLAKWKHKSHSQQPSTYTGFQFYQYIETISTIMSKRTQILWLLKYLKLFPSLFTIGNVLIPSKCVILYILKSVSLCAIWVRLWWKQTQPSPSPKRTLEIQPEQFRTHSEWDIKPQPQVLFHSLTQLLS